MSETSGIEASGEVLAPTLTPGLWVVERSASTVGFSIRHLAVATVRGRFTGFEGWFEVSPEGTGHAGGRVDVKSIDTGMEARDEHLRSAGGFHVSRYPEIAFEADLTASAPGFRLEGDLTIMDRTHPLELTGDVTSAHPDRVVVTARGVIRRREFGLQWSALIEAGAAVVGDRVPIRLDVTLRRRP